MLLRVVGSSVPWKLPGHVAAQLELKQCGLLLNGLELGDDDDVISKGPVFIVAVAIYNFMGHQMERITIFRVIVKKV